MPEGRPPRYFTLTPEQLAGYEVEENTLRPDKKEPLDKKLPVEIKESVVALRQALADRAAEFGLTPPKFDLPPLPPDFSTEHLAVFEKFLGAHLEVSTVPEVENWDEYFRMMYPEGKRPNDEQKGLVSYLPDWWKKVANTNIVGGPEKWGTSFIRSIKIDAEASKGQLFLTEAIQKPNYTNGKQQYGTKEGADDTQDYLLPIICEVLGDGKNRFSNNWDQVNLVAAKVKEKIVAELTAKRLFVPDFDVKITPAIISNLEMSLRHPENSTTTTSEWCSTPLLKQDNADSGYRLFVGRSGSGGAGCVRYAGRGSAWLNGGFRLSVVLKNT